MSRRTLSLFVASSCAWVCLVGLATSALAAEEGIVELKRVSDSIEVSIDGKPLAVYQFGKDLPKPFFTDVRSADGAILTRGLKDPEDHPHHKGIWLAIDEVNEIKFWAEKGKIRNASIELIEPKGNPARMRVVNHWLGEDGKPVAIESTTISIFANRLLGYDIRFTPGSGPVTFDDTKEGLFGIRVANTLREGRGGGGAVQNAEGLKGSKMCWGKTSDWVDYSGPVDGKTYGVAIFDHPENARRSRYHVRDYGLFSVSPFGSRAYTGGKEAANPLVLKQGEEFRLRYGLFIHQGDTQTAKIPQAFRFYVNNS